MKKIVAFLLVVALILCLCACSPKHYDENNISELYDKEWIVGKSREQIEDKYGEFNREYVSDTGENVGSYYVNYDIYDFEYSYNPFYIRIGKNYFSLDNIHVDIEDLKQNLIIYGDIGYTDDVNINTSILSPNIMGPFSYIPFMECNHAILSMKNNANGSIDINNIILNFENDMGYIEKDWGCSFPKTYIWCQGNNFKKSNSCFMLSIANVPFKMFNFRGMICVLIIDDKEYKFTTYNNSKILKCDVNEKTLEIVLKKDDYYFNLKSSFEKGQKLSAPVKGKMEKDIYESLNSLIEITLRKNDEIIFSDISTNCGIEIVRE